MGAADILLEIAAKRSERIKQLGAAEGISLPEKREVPLIRFGAEQAGKTEQNTAEEGILIAEIKRSSPSKGRIADIPEPVKQAELYKKAGFRRVSVLTESEYFGGSLNDLIKIKKAHPELAVLRKDFLLNEEDVLVSWKAGADAVLLIAALLEKDVIYRMYKRAEQLGLAALVEVHTKEDVDKVRAFRPPLVGINSRDLRTFRIEPLLPLETRSFIDWDCSIIFESGIKRTEDAMFVCGTGFAGFLVGESVARDPSFASKLIKAWQNRKESEKLYGVWSKLYENYRDDAPFVKICGITSYKDAEAAVNSGADILGFIFADSPRRADPEVLEKCAKLPVLKSAVVVLPPDGELPDETGRLLEKGLIDFIQFHGDESPELVRRYPGYKTLNLSSAAEADILDNPPLEIPGSPAVLIDAFSSVARGGTGKLLDESIVMAVKSRRRLWLAGGLNPENISRIVKKYRPSLVDAASGVELSKGVKDLKAVELFVKRAKSGFKAE